MAVVTSVLLLIAGVKKPLISGGARELLLSASSPARPHPQLMLGEGVSGASAPCPLYLAACMEPQGFGLILFF